jgi:hypothetical protein
MDLQLKVKQAREEARSLGVAFAPFSNWPFHWHTFVVDALRAGVRVGADDVYVKTKFGELRIQGRVAAIQDEIAEAARKAAQTCVGCGCPCTPAVVPDLPQCDQCNDLPGAPWIEVDDQDDQETTFRKVGSPAS